MIWLILGIALFVGAHFFKRIAPDQRAAWGNAGKGAVALAILAGLILMIVGYLRAAHVNVWFPPTWTVHLNNLLMLIAVLLLGAGHSKSRLRARLRHPMLSAVSVWSVAHLLVNGDLASIILFGSLGLWAVASIVIVNRSEPAPASYAGGTVAGDIRLGLITLAVFAAIAGIHIALGVWPFPGR
ncbi:NnrU family protein [Halodurantibacterium flavum]|uniref:NnrU family protein n=1 Tax=Halodurantibacterium flavum TaxID=1382802 RepID=A0ABW4S2C6_9RHOB